MAWRYKSCFCCFVLIINSPLVSPRDSYQAFVPGVSYLLRRILGRCLALSRPWGNQTMESLQACESKVAIPALDVPCTMVLDTTSDLPKVASRVIANRHLWNASFAYREASEKRPPNIGVGFSYFEEIDCDSWLTWLFHKPGPPIFEQKDTYDPQGSF